MKLNETKNRGLELNDLAMKYQETKEDRYFNELWNEVEAFAYSKGSKYNNTISKEDMKELAMVSLYDCCRCLKEGTNVLTYYGSVLVNRYHDFYKRPRTRGNDKINNEALSLDMEYEDGGTIYTATVEDDYFSREHFYDECKLLDLEAQMVELLYCGYKKNEIIKMLGLQNNVLGKRPELIYKQILKSVRGKVNKYYEIGTI